MDLNTAGSEMDCIAPSPVTCVDIFSNSWDPQRIEKAILKGNELCKLKRRQCDVFRSPPCPARDRQYRYKPVPPCQITASHNERLQPYCMSPAPPTYRSKGSRRRKCPLRIMELAMPSKRQCIETWRTMKDVLPDFMVERLKNLITDENILAGIPEAFTTFKQKGPRGNKRSKNQTKGKARTTKDMEQIKMISALFGSKLVGKLYKPQTTKLNPKLEKISKIVNKDVIDLIKKRHASFTKGTQNEDILNEVSDRVAIWISLILQDASYKLLEEELKELEEQEGPVLDILDQLVNDVLDKLEPYPPEEYRGDTSGDEHFESVSEGGKSDHSTDGQFQDSFSSPEDIHKEIDEAAKTPDLLSPEDIDEAAHAQNQEIEPDLSSPEDFDEIKSDLISSDDIDKSALESIENQIIDDDADELKGFTEQTSDPTKQIGTTTKSENTEEENNLLEGEKGDLDSTRAREKTDDAKDNQEKDNEDSSKLEVFDNNVEDQSLTSTPVPELDTIAKSPKYQNVNEINESSTDGDKTNEPFEEKDKTDNLSIQNIASDTKVENTVAPEEDSSSQKDVSTLNETDKIHKILDDESDLNRFENKIKPGQEVTVAKDDEVDIDNKDEESNLDSSHTPQVHREESVDKKVKFSDSDIGRKIKSMKPDLMLGPVNENLLSDADESWPEKFVALRPAASVTKSMESLGKIKEYDETQLTSQNEDRRDKIDQIHKKDGSKASLSETELNKDVISKEHRRKIRSNDSIEISGTYYDGFDSQPQHEGELDEKDDHRHRDDDAGDAKKYENKRNAKGLIESKAQKYEGITQKDESPFKTKPPEFDYSKSKTIYTDDDTGDAKKSEGKHAEELIESEAQKYEGMTQKDGSSFKTKPSKFDYKVCLETAPSWVKNGHGEPSIDDLITRIKERQKLKKLCLQNWVTDLRNVATKLEKWNQWIETASFNIVYLKKKRNIEYSGRHCHREVQDWVQLHKSVDNDVLLWTKLYQRKRVKLQRNKDIPKEIKCDCMRC